MKNGVSSKSISAAKEEGRGEGDACMGEDTAVLNRKKLDRNPQVVDRQGLREADL